jgi:hypothetical protein
LAPFSGSAACDILDVALRMVEIENHRSPLQPYPLGELLIQSIINERRAREARAREAALQKSLESTSLEGKRQCLAHAEPKNPADNPTSSDPATPQEARVRAQQLITDHACAALSVLRQAMFDYRAPPATRRAAERAMREAKVRMAKIEGRKAWLHRYDRFGALVLQLIQ